jgi:hypothetical protein
VLLTIWFGLALFAVDALLTVGSELERRGRLLLALGGSALVSLGAFVIRPWYAARDSFVERNAEVAIGRAARDLGGPTARLLIDAPDYGYFAVIAGFGAPDRAEPVDDRDPRKARPPDAFRSVSALRARAREAGATWIVTHGDHAAIAAEVGPVVREVGSLSLTKVRAD